MTDRMKLSEKISVDGAGRVSLSDAQLDALLSASDTASAGGGGSVNDHCSNTADCTETLNTAACTNSGFCDGSLNAAGQCKSPREVPGG